MNPAFGQPSEVTELWKEPKRCDACGQTCRNWGAYGQPCYGELGGLGAGDADEDYLHHCEGHDPETGEYTPPPGRG